VRYMCVFEYSVYSKVRDGISDTTSVA
jgi:hypothetical protein